MNNINKIIEMILKIGTLISFILMIIVVFIQVFCRFVFFLKAPHWTEEASRFLYVYMISFACGIAIKEKAFVNVDTFINKFSLKIQKIIKIIINIIVFIFMLIFLYYSIPYIKIGHLQKSPSFEIRMSYIFFSMFIMGFFVCYFTLINIIDLINHKDKKDEIKINIMNKI